MFRYRYRYIKSRNRTELNADSQGSSLSWFITGRPGSFHFWHDGIEINFTFTLVRNNHEEKRID